MIMKDARTIRRLPQYHLPELPQVNIKTKGPSGISKGIPRGKHLTGQAGQAQISNLGIGRLRD